MNMELKQAIEVLKQHKSTTDKFNHTVGNVKVSEAIDTVVKELEKPTYTAEEMYLNMQYYMEYCQMKGYVTPMEWLEKHKHFGKEAATRGKALQDKVDFLKSAKQPSEITHPYDLSKK